MVYNNDEEMNRVIGRLDENSFILQQQEEEKLYTEKVREIIELLSA